MFAWHEMHCVLLMMKKRVILLYYGSGSDVNVASPHLSYDISWWEVVVS